MTTSADKPDAASRPAEEGWADFEPGDAVDADDPPPGERPRGGSLLQDLADVLRNAGLTVKEVDGWESRQRGGTGYQMARPLGIIVHHTASGSSTNGQADVDYMTFNCPDRPLANLYLDRGGQWWVLAAGATNTNGTGGPWGPLPLDGANSRVLGIEAANNGVGEPWPEVMQDSYVKGVAALATAYQVETKNILAHYEWAPTRKVDPAGPSRFGSVNSSGSWNMNTFRAAVDHTRGQGGSTPTIPPPSAKLTGNTYVVAAGDTWWGIAAKTLGDPAKNWPALADANGGSTRVLHAGEVLTIPGGAPPPAFPGEAELGDQGPVVLAWQVALISQGVIEDTASNRDSTYDDEMRSDVLRLQQSWDWDDADGIAGKHTWAKLHGGD